LAPERSGGLVVNEVGQKMLKWFLLVRHVESRKNIDARFASRDHDDCLTQEGQTGATYLADQIAGFVKFMKVREIEVHTSQSMRAKLTAEVIARRLRSTYHERDDLGSLITAFTTGRTYDQLLDSDIEFARQFLLYRAGVFDSYRMKHYGDLARAFETRIYNVLIELTSRTGELFIIVSHRSTLTSALIEIARRGGHYPNFYSGFVPLSLGSCSLARFSTSPTWRLLFADLSPTKLNSVGIKLISTEIDRS
jgi:broad specificity phosphatase PhoE